jgi:hypothetical protein
VAGGEIERQYNAAFFEDEGARQADFFAIAAVPHSTAQSCVVPVERVERARFGGQVAERSAGMRGMLAARHQKQTNESSEPNTCELGFVRPSP